MTPPIPESAALLRPYLPRMLLQWLAEAPGTILREIDGTVVFVDISGFTKMSERLARKGKVGAEEVTEVLGAVFARLLAVAYGNGGGLIKFGGDALLAAVHRRGPSGEAARARPSGCAAPCVRSAPIESSAGKHHAAHVRRRAQRRCSCSSWWGLAPRAHDHRARRQRDRATWRAPRSRARSSPAARPPPRLPGALLGQPKGGRRPAAERAAGPRRLDAVDVDAAIDGRRPDAAACPSRSATHLLVGRRGAGAPAGDGGVHPLRRRRRDGRARGRRRRSPTALRRTGRRSVQDAADEHGVVLPRHGHRPRRRQDHPRRRAPQRARRRRGADAARAARA